MLRRKTSSGGICERCDQRKRTITICEYGDKIDICRECIHDNDFSREDKNEDKIIISEEDLNWMVLDLGEVLHKRGIKLYYNEDFNCLRYALVKEFLNDWLSYKGPTYYGHTKWWELASKHPYWKDISEPKR